MPSVGLGTYLMSVDESISASQSAIKLGYTHIDTASIYRNEIGVAKGIELSGIKREEVFVTSKLKPKDQGLKKIGKIEVFLRHRT